MNSVNSIYQKIDSFNYKCITYFVNLIALIVERNDFEV